MKIDRKLNLVVPITREDGTTIYVHAMPISREVFERYFIVISKAFSAIYTEGLGYVAGPRVAAMLIKDIAQRNKMWDGDEGVAQGLVAEWRRLANMLVLGAKGWEAIPFQEALDHGTIDADDASEVENAIAYFTVASSMHRKQELSAAFDGVSNLWGAQTVSSSYTEYMNFLQTPIAPASTGAKAPASSLPS